MGLRFFFRRLWILFSICASASTFAAPLCFARASAQRIVRPSAQPSRLRSQLLKEYGIKAVDKTDRHSPAVLANLLLLLQSAFGKDEIENFRQFRYLYAYEGHDSHYDIAAYHPETKAISIGGKDTYSDQDPDHQIVILAALAHEMGHAFLMERVSAEELERISRRYGGWGPVFKGSKIDDLYSPRFFSAHPLSKIFNEESSSRPIDRKYVEQDRWKKNSLASRYAEKNVHEWFADVFAAYALNELGKKNLLGKDWREKLISLPLSQQDYWTNYNNISNPLKHWIAQKLKGF